jgi:hypothetical protein
VQEKPTRATDFQCKSEATNQREYTSGLDKQEKKLSKNNEHFARGGDCGSTTAPSLPDAMAVHHITPPHSMLGDADRGLRLNISF